MPWLPPTDAQKSQHKTRLRRPGKHDKHCEVENSECAPTARCFRRCPIPQSRPRRVSPDKNPEIRLAKGDRSKIISHLCRDFAARGQRREKASQNYDSSCSGSRTTGAKRGKKKIPACSGFLRATGFDSGKMCRDQIHDEWQLFCFLQSIAPVLGRKPGWGQPCNPPKQWNVWPGRSANSVQPAFDTRAARGDREQNLLKDRANCRKGEFVARDSS